MSYVNYNLKLKSLKKAGEYTAETLKKTNKDDKIILNAPHVCVVPVV